MNDIQSAASALGKKGGKAKSERKTAAVRENGKKGGRPSEMDRLLAAYPGKIAILSGEGCGPGKAVIYDGARTGRAIKARLARERGVSRWAKALIWSHQCNEPLSDAAINAEGGCAEGWPDGL